MVVNDDTDFIRTRARKIYSLYVISLLKIISCIVGDFRYIFEILQYKKFTVAEIPFKSHWRS